MRTTQQAGAVGPTNDDHPAVAKYRSFLEWDIVEQPTSTRVAEKVLSPVLGKSCVHYATKPDTAADRADAAEMAGAGA